MQVLYYKGNEDGKTRGKLFLINKIWKHHIVVHDNVSGRDVNIIIQALRRCKLQIIQFTAPKILKPKIRISMKM